MMTRAALAAAFWRSVIAAALILAVLAWIGPPR